MFCRDVNSRHFRPDLFPHGQQEVQCHLWLDTRVTKGWLLKVKAQDEQI
jgi:hypothetical protein